MVENASKLTFVGLLAAALLVPPSGADAQQGPQRQVIERVVAVVNEDAIFLSELRRRSVPFLEQVVSAPEGQRQARLEQLQSELLGQLIDEELIQQAASEMQVRVSSADVERAIANVRQQSQLGEDEFWQAVRAQGFTEAQYRQDVRRQLLRLKVMNTRLRGRVNITEEDVRAKYDQMVRRANRNACFEVSMIVVPTTEGASATEVAQQRQAAEQLRTELTPGTFQDHESAIDLGRLCEGELNPAFEQAIAGLSQGEISDPVRGDRGFHLFQLVRREAVASDVPAYDQVRQDLYRQMLEQAMSRQEDLFLEELRRDAVVDRRI